MIKSLVKDYGVKWVFNRFLYSTKLNMLKRFPISERLFEKSVDVKRIDIFEINIDAIEAFLKNIDSGEKEKIITIADNSINGKIKGFSSVELDYGSPIQWNYHPMTKARVDVQRKWFQIPDFDPNRGDIKAIWEASRFTHFFYLSRAFMLTKDEKYYYAFSSQLESWVKQNPYPYGPHYKCGQEATLRMIAALMNYSVFSQYGLPNSGDVRNLKKLVEGSYKKVLSNFFYAKNCIKNNHTLSEITGLIIGSWCAVDSKSLNRAYKLLEKEIKFQFSYDGGYIQNSVNYQRFALQIMECVMALGDATGKNLSKESQSLVYKSAQQLYQIQSENGDVPNRGSNDGALIFPVTNCNYRDFRPVINTINSLIDNQRIYDKGLYDEEILWFTNIKDICEISQVEIKRKTFSYPEAGLYTLRYNDNSFLMTILKDNKTRPTHMDQLHIDLWHKGINVFCDAGSYSYADPEGKKLAFTSAHNTVKVDGKEQMTKKGAFLVLDWSRAKNIDYNSSHFSGTMVSQKGYEHTRKIQKNEMGYSVNDVVVGDVEECDFYFHTPCDVKVTKTGFDLYNKGQLMCSIQTDGLVRVQEAYRSLYYLNKEEINCVTVKGSIEEKQYSMNFNIELK
ncbi:heparinase II/III family protein [Bacillus shivajii]|uniref:heparinase II/III domain-containing protein n=1 Tax=Bacillus shivajii TaxID=1983719 RepID=UPI001CF96904|nr:heparinase II/III family protein [Bacillus shivajii]UCZ52950.1 heparinase II/III family protein [Bacillus shivajii]